MHFCLIELDMPVIQSGTYAIYDSPPAKMILGCFCCVLQDHVLLLQFCLRVTPPGVASFQDWTLRVVLDDGFLRLCPIHPHFLRLICMFLSCSPTYFFICDPFRQLCVEDAPKTGIVKCLVFLQVCSGRFSCMFSFSKTDLTLEFKINSLVVVRSTVWQQCGCFLMPICSLAW